MSNAAANPSKSMQEAQEVATEFPVVINNDTGLVEDHTPSKAASKPGDRLRLTTLEEVHRELQSVYRRMKSGKIAPEIGTKLTYTLRTLFNISTIRELNANVLELQEQLARRGVMTMLPANDDEAEL